ncbi:alkane hydroxylase MAH1-like [Lotus japonicus]|uniref:alkane hydroxylase MAH1-like n=1 Tax=Lotus japonicus TaxID=34305 RepID=UPI00258901B7|nr:alkane hydroxylase MAH1-like [Lotus japonicus]
MMAMIECIAAFAVLLFFIFIHIWRRNRGVLLPNWPILGMLPAIWRNMSDFNNFATLILKDNGGTARFQGPWLTDTNFIFTSDPMNVNHITSKNFGNYGKGPNFHDIFEILGIGIVNSDSHDWKQQRAMLHSMFQKKSFEILLQQTIEKKVQNCLLPILTQISKVGATVDLQDIFERFTFDTTSTTLFGFDPHCLPSRFDELSEIACEKSLPILEDAIFFRHLTPTFIWKLQKWLQIGVERNFNVAQKKFDQFLHQCVAYSKREDQQSEGVVEESNFHLLKSLMKEGSGNGKVMSDKFLKDTAFNLLAAGNGTIAAGLSWLFWLVSTHPIVEGKIIQEIKDNCLIQEGNFLDLDKLVYLHGAVCEALRLFPPIPFEHKCAVNHDTLPSGHQVSANMKILYLLYPMARMEHIWGDDCLEFKPERWISDNGRNIHMPSYKFITFNGGPRSCLGKGFSFIMLKMVAAAIIPKFHIQVIEGHPITPRLSVVMGMKYGLKVQLTKRCI